MTAASRTTGNHVLPGLLEELGLDGTIEAAGQLAQIPAALLQLSFSAGSDVTLPEGVAARLLEVSE
ncbi:hypothetical protein P3T36_004882 [Kitasatospora sp. MAP12-15]|uniref:hypothetical protein n=1 Tax=unclassified Kitasatospora TaxID=2633591 RepID=UPI002475C652|nr:hypothetical protein [Kitasatospora sp. MAP12-44]MDH6110186.1 hypothetical protein [Kitasatospora sp. MAP12-44]